MNVYWVKTEQYGWWPAQVAISSNDEEKNENKERVLVRLFEIQEEISFPNKKYLIPFDQVSFPKEFVDTSLQLTFQRAVAAAKEMQQNAQTRCIIRSETKKRENYISWDEYFMGLACLSAMRSKDPNTQVGACIVNEYNQIVGIGYNGFPRGCSDDLLPWGREGANELETKYMYVCHAEMNAILNINTANARGCKLYVSLFPCNNCCKMIIQSGITEVIYLGDKYHDSNMSIASRLMFDMAGVKYTEYCGKRRDIVIGMGE